jgi:hypothetical protein
VVSGFNSAFQPNNSQARYTGSSSTQSVNNSMQSQGILARQSALIRAGLIGTQQYSPPPTAAEEAATQQRELELARTMAANGETMPSAAAGFGQSDRYAADFARVDADRAALGLSPNDNRNIRVTTVDGVRTITDGTTTVTRTI